MANAASSTVSSKSYSLYLRVGKRSNGASTRGNTKPSVLGKIGAVHSIRFEERLTLEEEYEVNALAIGLPRAIVPQNLLTRSITLERYDLYASTLEQLLGIEVDGIEGLSLASNAGPLALHVYKTSPITGQVQTRVYQGCYCESVGRTVDAKNNTIVGANAVLRWKNYMDF
jgi:hypothetical protein